MSAEEVNDSIFRSNSFLINGEIMIICGGGVKFLASNGVIIFSELNFQAFPCLAIAPNRSYCVCKNAGFLAYFSRPMPLERFVEGVYLHCIAFYCIVHYILHCIVFCIVFFIMFCIAH